MTEKFPVFYVSRQPKDAENLEPVYYKVTGYDPGGHVFYRNEGDKRSREGTFYGLFLEANHGFGVEWVERADTPWADE